MPVTVAYSPVKAGYGFSASKLNNHNLKCILKGEIVDKTGVASF